MKLIHVLAAIVAVGSNVTYGFWLVRGSRDPKALPFALQGVKLIDDRVANPSYGLLLVTGILLVLVGHIPITTSWVIVALALYVAAVLLGALGYTPSLKRQILLLESEGAQSGGFRAAAKRGTVIGAVLGVMVLLIIFLMVFKPVLWGEPRAALVDASV
ncbi:MAG: DUF2269 family protein [Spirochaetia bacterium]